jgi:transposase
MKQALEQLSIQELIALLEQEKMKFGIAIAEQKIKFDSELSYKNQLIEKLRRMLFGSKKERFIKAPIDEHQLSLPFEELAAKDETSSEKTVKEIVTYERKKNKKHKGRNTLPNDLEVTEIVIQPDNYEPEMIKIGEEVTEILELAPAKFFKLRIIRPKYVFKNKEEKDDTQANQGVFIGQLPSRPIEKCLAGNVLLASILINKYVDHLPLYRQIEIFKRHGISIAPSTVDGWVSQLGTLLYPLYQAMVNALKNDGYLQADETPSKVLDKNKKGECHLGYYWVYHSPLKRMVVFDYQRGRDKEASKNILGNFKGYLQTDGYAAYRQYKEKEGVTHLACWAHARRYFDQAKTQDKLRAEYALGLIQDLYTIERELKEGTSEDRKEKRLEKSLPIINQLGKWISEQNKNVLPKSPIGKAFTYSINLWDSLQSYLYNGELLIDNNLIENTIRPNALGRKNYLFAGSDEGAKRTAMFYSFMGTCKLNGVNPMEWLTAVLEKIADHKANKLHELFPQNLQLPKESKGEKKQES